MPARRRWLLTMPLLALAAAGCDGAKAKKTAGGPAPIQTRETLNKKTQDIRKLEDEVAKGGQAPPDKKLGEGGYLGVVSDSYVYAIDQISEMSVKHSIDIYEATNGSYPKDYDEFMTNIIKANDIWLPMLPYYQEYAYNEKEHKLVVLEYPAKKAQREKERDGK